MHLYYQYSLDGAFRAIVMSLTTPKTSKQVRMPEKIPFYTRLDLLTNEIVPQKKEITGVDEEGNYTFIYVDDLDAQRIKIEE